MTLPLGKRRLFAREKLFVCREKKRQDSSTSRNRKKRTNV
jgi:hypothetical protein